MSKGFALGSWLMAQRFLHDTSILCSLLTVGSIQEVTDGQEFLEVARQHPKPIGQLTFSISATCSSLLLQPRQEGPEMVLSEAVMEPRERNGE